MKNRTLWQVSILTSTEAEEAVSAWAEEALGAPAASYTDVESRAVTVTVCLPRKPVGDVPTRRAFAAGLDRIRDCGLDLGPGTFSLKRLSARSWVDSWKRHFPPLEIGRALLLKPSWSRRRARRGQSVIVLDPGLSFGTGRHPTTAFCLGQVVARRKPEQAQSFLDIGTGSGILAIAAAKLGYRPIRAFDFDSDAVRVAGRNATRNRVSIPFARRDVTRLPARSRETYSLVCANLMANLLVAESARIAARVEPGGTLVLAGILKEEFPTVQAAYEKVGFRLVASRADHEWRSGALRKRNR